MLGLTHPARMVFLDFQPDLGSGPLGTMISINAVCICPFKVAEQKPRYILCISYMMVPIRVGAVVNYQPEPRHCSLHLVKSCKFNKSSAFFNQLVCQLR